VKKTFYICRMDER